MSPRQLIVEVSECEYATLEEYLSSRGELTVKFVCKHPENEGCLCMESTPAPDDCEFCDEEEE